MLYIKVENFKENESVNAKFLDDLGIDHVKRYRPEKKLCIFLNHIHAEKYKDLPEDRVRTLQTPPDEIKNFLVPCGIMLNEYLSIVGIQIYFVYSPFFHPTVFGLSEIN